MAKRELFIPSVQKLREPGPKPQGSRVESGADWKAPSPRTARTRSWGANSNSICRQAPQGQQKSLPRPAMAIAVKPPVRPSLTALTSAVRSAQRVEP